MQKVGVINVLETIFNKTFEEKKDSNREKLFCA